VLGDLVTVFCLHLNNTAVQEEQPLTQNWVHYAAASGKGTCGWQFNTYGSTIKWGDGCWVIKDV